jgi:hypothetical protein
MGVTAKIPIRAATNAALFLVVLLQYRTSLQYILTTLIAPFAITKNELLGNSNSNQAEPSKKSCACLLYNSS